MRVTAEGAGVAEERVLLMNDTKDAIEAAGIADSSQYRRSSLSSWVGLSFAAKWALSSIVAEGAFVAEATTGTKVLGR